MNVSSSLSVAMSGLLLDLFSTSSLPAAEEHWGALLTHSCGFVPCWLCALFPRGCLWASVPHDPSRVIGGVEILIQ